MMDRFFQATGGSQNQRGIKQVRLGAIGIQPQGVTEAGLGGFPVIVVRGRREGQGGVRFGQGIIYLERLLRSSAALPDRLLYRDAGVLAHQIAIRQSRPCRRHARLLREDTLETFNRGIDSGAGSLVPVVTSLEIERVTLKVTAMKPFSPAAHGRASERCRNGIGNLLLNLEEVLVMPIKTLRPEMASVTGVDQLGGDAQAVVVAPHTSFQKRTHAEARSDCADIARFSFEVET